jgi:bacterioferritin (cytochrome b1)
MTKNNMIVLLNEIVRHERKHFMYYQHCHLIIRGYERAILGPVFEKEMNSELEHVCEFSAKVVALGGTPDTGSGVYHVPLDGFAHREMLEGAIALEREVLRIYHSAYPLAEKYAEEHGDMSIALLLEENIEHTTKDVEELEKLLPSS